MTHCAPYYVSSVVLDPACGNAASLLAGEFIKVSRLELRYLRPLNRAQS